MRQSLIVFAFSAVVAISAVLQGQTTSQDSPWRASYEESQPIVLSNLPRTTGSQARTPSPVTPMALANYKNMRTEVNRVAQNRMQEVRSDQGASSTVTQQRFLVSFVQSQDQDLGDSQPSVSDVTQKTDPSVPGGESVVDPPMASSAPVPVPLDSVVSNATQDETNYCDRNCKKDGCNLGCERKLFGNSPRGLELGGWANVGYHNRNNIMLNNRKAEGNLHQAWLYLDKAASKNCTTWDIGYRADLLYGIDGQDLQAFGNPPAGAPTGWDNSWDYGSYGWALPQAYIQFANDTWDVKLGKFFSPFGYEVIAAPDNFFYSHSYTMYYSEPFTMSGALAERQVTDTRSAIVGVATGWDTGFDSDTGGCLITGHRFQLNENVNVALTTCWGDRGRRGVGALNTGVAQVQLSEDLKYVVQGDYLDFGTNQEFGIVQYLFRDLSQCVAVGARLEWWKSDQLFANTKSTYEYTMGANLKPNANITIRPEVRWDWGAAAIDPGTTIIGLDVVATF